MPRTWIVLCLVLPVMACSAVKLAYHQLDWVASFYVESHVSLDDAQSTLLKDNAAQLLRWHCGTQVTGYARQLRELGADVQNGRVTRAHLARTLDRILDHWQAIRTHTVPRMTELMATASDEQIGELMESFARQNRKFAAEHIERPESGLREQAEATLIERLEDWIDDLTPTQRQAVSTWREQYALNGVERLELRQRWQAELQRVLGERAHRERLAAGVRQLVAHPEQYWSAVYREKLERNRELTLTLLADVAASLEPSQREHFARHANRWAETFEGLACAPTPTSEKNSGLDRVSAFNAASGAGVS